MLCLTLVDEGARGADVRASVTVPPGQASFSIGRDPACDWTLPDRTLAVSARHCEIVRAAAGLLLRDHSTNGTYVTQAGQRDIYLRREELPLQDKGEISLGCPSQQSLLLISYHFSN